jgi:cytochrome oxidase Cu insertion factor (SCO1/SenC/PrrC family)
MSRTALYAAGFLLLAAGVLTIVTAASLKSRAPGSSGQPTDTPSVDVSSEWMTEYALTERRGREFHSGELNDKVHVVNFFFSTCPSVCRQQSNKVSQLVDEFGPQGVVFLSITCDPDQDTPAVLNQYAKMYNADAEQWLFLTSPDLTYLRRVGAEVYQLPVDKQTHSERLVVLDKWGKIRGRFDWSNLQQMYEMSKQLETLLAEEQQPAPEVAVPPDSPDEEEQEAEEELENQP